MALFSVFASRGDVTKPGNCKWCGRKLRPQWRMEDPPVVKTWIEDNRFQEGHAVDNTRVRPVKVGEPKWGDYSDGHFCGLRCGYDFAVWFADRGNFIRPKGKS